MKVCKLMMGVCLGFGLGFGEEVKTVEPEVRADFETALKRLPEPLRTRVRDVELVREEDLGVGDEFPLEYRLLNRAAYASLSVMERTLSVYDAGAVNRPEWKGEAPGAGEVAKMLAGVADVLGVKAPSGADDPALAVAWEAFVKRVYSWGEGDAPEVMPPVGDPMVLNHFLREGVWRLMGGKVERVPLMVHEFAHALQLEPNFTSLMDRMRFWGALSGFVESKSGEATDGFAGGTNKTENVIVLIRLLLADDPAMMSRGANADYGTAREARFVNRYARFDLREDYAESFRLMAYDPERLAKVAPEKFIYLNALGWNARLDGREPGPLWYSGEEFDRLIPKVGRKDLFARLFGRDGKGLGLEVEALAAILRAHKGELSPEELPEPYAVLEVPEDLPGFLKMTLDPTLLQVEIGGVVYAGETRAQRERQDKAIVSLIGESEYEVGMMKFSTRGTAGVMGGYDDVRKQVNPVKRGSRYEAMREASEELLSRKEWNKLDRQEAEFHRAKGNDVIALRYEFLSSGGKPEKLLEEVEVEVMKLASDFDRGVLFGTGVDLLLRAGEAKAVREQIAKIPGKTMGRYMRVRYLLKAAKVVGGDGEKAQFREAARAEAEACELPELKKQLQVLMLK